MFKDNNWKEEDPLAVGRGITYGILIGSILWAAIIGCVIYIWF